MKKGLLNTSADSLFRKKKYIGEEKKSTQPQYDQSKIKKIWWTEGRVKNGGPKGRNRQL